MTKEADNTPSHTHLKELRIEAGLTQTELGVLVGVSRETVSAIENGKVSQLENLGVPKINRWYATCLEHASNNARKDKIKTIFSSLKRNIWNHFK